MLSHVDLFGSSERLLLSCGLPYNTGDGSAGFELSKEGKRRPFPKHSLGLYCCIHTVFPKNWDIQFLAVPLGGT